MIEQVYDVGIVGGGQLGMMSAQAASELGLSTIVLDPGGVDCSAAKIAGAESIKGSLRDQSMLLKLARRARFLTVEIEHLDPQALQIAVEAFGLAVYPNPELILQIQNKFLQHQRLSDLGIPVAYFREINSCEDVMREFEASSTGLILKAQKDASDGRGNFAIETVDDIQKGMDHLQGENKARALYIEHIVPFEKEVAMMVARDVYGHIKTYPLVETRHLRGQLREVIAPAQVDDQVHEQARDLVLDVSDRFLQSAGIFGIEMFVEKNGQIMINEIAPRPHNSGHYSIEGCVTSQFTNHILAITGQRVERCDLVANFVGMVNIIGDYSNLSQVETIPDIYIHDYGKSPRHERKLGHVTILGDNQDDFDQRFNMVSSLLTR